MLCVILFLFITIPVEQPVLPPTHSNNQPLKTTYSGIDLIRDFKNEEDLKLKMTSKKKKSSKIKIALRIKMSSKTKITPKKPQLEPHLQPS